MGIAYVTDNTLTADVLTQRMPLSEAFHKANSAFGKAGVRYGFTLDYGSRTSLKVGGVVSELVIAAGVADVGLNSDPLITNKENKTMDNQLLTVELSTDLTIDISGFTPSTIYKVFLDVDYTASDISISSGLVINPGVNQARIVIDDSGAAVSDAGNLLYLGSFQQSTGYIESASQQVQDEAGCNLKNGFAYEYTKERGALDYSVGGSTLQVFKDLVNISNFTNLKKQIKISDIQTATELSEINSSLVLEVDDVDFAYDGTIVTNYATTGKGIWLNVESMKFENCYFKGDLELTMHRTPGNDTFYNLGDDTDSGDNAVDLTTYIDYGARQLVIDGGGAVVEGNFNLDLVTDFVGHIYDFVYRITLKNFTIKGDLNIKMGSSRKWIKSGKFASFTYENVIVIGNNYIDHYPRQAAASQVAAYSVNNAQDEGIGPFAVNVDNYGGYAHGGSLLTANGKYRTDGTLVFYFHFDDAAGTNFLQEKTYGAIVIKNSTLPNYLFKFSNATAEAYKVDYTYGAADNFFDKRRYITVRLENSLYITESSEVAVINGSIVTTVYELMGLNVRNTFNANGGTAATYANDKRLLNINGLKTTGSFQIGGFPKKVFNVTSATWNAPNSYLDVITSTDMITWIKQNLRAYLVSGILGADAATTDRGDWLFDANGDHYPITFIYIVNTTRAYIGLGSAPDVSPLLDCYFGSCEEFGDSADGTPITPTNISDLAVQNKVSAEEVESEISIAKNSYIKGTGLFGSNLSDSYKATIAGDASGGLLLNSTTGGVGGTGIQMSGTTIIAVGASVVLEGTTDVQVNSPALKVDTVSELTGSNGVDIEDVKLIDGYVQTHKSYTPIGSESHPAFRVLTIAAAAVGVGASPSISLPAVVTASKIILATATLSDGAGGQIYPGNSTAALHFSISVDTALSKIQFYNVGATLQNKPYRITLIYTV